MLFHMLIVSLIVVLLRVHVAHQYDLEP